MEEWYNPVMVYFKFGICDRISNSDIGRLYLGCLWDIKVQ